MNTVLKLCEKYDGEFYQEGIRKFTYNFPQKPIHDFHVNLKYKGKEIIIKKIVNFDSYNILMQIGRQKDLKLKIRLKTLANSIKNIIGKGYQVAGRYEFIGKDNYVESILNNELLVDMIIEKDVYIEIIGDQHSTLLLKPFKGIANVMRGEEYFEILWLLENEIDNPTAINDQIFV